MSDKFIVEIISPDQTILKQETSEVIIPSFEGQMGILKDHISLITFLRPGFILIKGEKEKKYYVEEGTVEFSNNNLTILSSTIIEVSALSSEKISKMIEDGKNQLNQENLDDKTRYVVSHKIDCLSRINL